MFSQPKGVNLMKTKKYFSVILTLLFVFSSVPLGAVAQSTIASQVSLFAKAGSGDYYTIYTNGLKKEDSYIGGFKSVQLDPQEENIYFYDTVLKVIARINIQDGKVYKVIGKPKSSIVLDYRTPVKFADASLGPLGDFTFDKYGNIYILAYNKLTDENGSPGATLDPRILKANLKDGTIKEVLNFGEYFKTVNPYSSYSITLTNLSYDQNKFIYAYGKSAFPDPSYGVSQWNNIGVNGTTIYKFDPISGIAELFGGNSVFSQIGFNPKYIFNPNNSNYLTLKALAFDYNGNCYIGTSDYQNSTWIPFITKLVPETNNDGKLVEQSFVGDGTGSTSDIGDGGQAKSAYAGISSGNCFCGDKNGDIYFADVSTNRIRRILNDSGLITTAVGGGSESLTYGQFKSPKVISLQYPNSILVDKSNNLYIAENNRILTVTNLIIHDDKPSELIKIANLAITKIAGNSINNPKGDITLPDLKLDYTFSGDQTVEVKGENIPDGTNVKLLSVNTDGTTTLTNNSGKFVSNITSIPVKIEAGTTKVIKAETDPFIPAPGVYLPGNAPQITTGELPPEPQSNAINRDQVNLVTKDTNGNITGNFIPLSQRFNFGQLASWTTANRSVSVNPYTTQDPDNITTDVSTINFSTTNDTLLLDTFGTTSTYTFSIWLKSDSGNINIPIAIGPNCPDRRQPTYFSYQGWEGCSYPPYFAGGQTGNTPLLSYSTITVTPSWQKFTVKSIPSADGNAKAVFIGGLTLSNGKKIYAWGARLEKSQ